MPQHPWKNRLLVLPLNYSAKLVMKEKRLGRIGVRWFSTPHPTRASKVESVHTPHPDSELPHSRASFYHMPDVLQVVTA